jgi:transposase-like protein
MPSCPRCQSTRIKKDGSNSAGQQRYRWPVEVIATAVRWYCQFGLSLANVRDLPAERHVDVSAPTILSWVPTFGPLFAQAVRRHARRVGLCWYCDETYVRLRGARAYLYRAVDAAGQVVDVLRASLPSSTP